MGQMSDMSGEELNAALEDDIAQKASAASQVVVHPGVPVTTDDVEHLEVKQAYLAKAVSLSYVDAAHACVRLALHEISPPVDTSGNLNKPRPKADAKRVELLMALGERAVKIAKDLDVLGDKALVRVEPQTQTQTQIQEQ